MSKTIFQLHDTRLELGDDVLETINGLLSNGSHLKRRKGKLRDLTTVAMLPAVKAERRTGVEEGMAKSQSYKHQMEKREVENWSARPLVTEVRKAKVSARPIGQSFLLLRH
jgi:hypothetical protein